MLQSPCCENNYICRFCHDEKENHALDRTNITKVQCLVCSTIQDLNQYCSNKDCGVILGNVSIYTLSNYIINGGLQALLS